VVQTEILVAQVKVILLVLQVLQVVLVIVYLVVPQVLLVVWVVKELVNLHHHQVQVVLQVVQVQLGAQD